MLRDREIWTFLVVIVLANTAFIGLISMGWLPLWLYDKGRFLLLGGMLALVVFAFHGFAGCRSLLMPMTVWRVHPLWFAAALLWPPLMCSITLLSKGMLTGSGLAEWHMSFDTVSQPGVMRSVLLAAFIGEIVWVSYAVGRLSSHASVLVASLIVGFFWTLWWTPIVLIGIGVIPGLPLGALLVNMMGVAAMCGFFYAFTSSGLVVLTLQLSLNSSMLMFPVAPGQGGIATYWTFAFVYLAGALILYAAFGRSLRYRKLSV